MNLIEIEKWQREMDLEDLEGFRHGTRPAPTLYHAGTVKISDGDAPMVFIASDEGPNRKGDVVLTDGWDIEAFKLNPLFMWLHEMDENHLLPIGRVPKVWTEAKELLAAVEWDTADAFANEIRGKYQRGFLKAVSVGFRPLEFEETESERQFSVKFLKQELLEISAVPIPANPRALKRAMGWPIGNRRSYSLPPQNIAITTTTQSPTFTGNTVIDPSLALALRAAPDPLAPIARAMRELKEALCGPGGK